MHTLSAREINRLFLEGEASAVEIATHFLKRINDHKDELGCFISVFDEEVLERAKALDEKKAAGKPLGKLAAVPVSIKDNLQYSGHKMTCASEFLSGYTSPFTATCVEHLLAEDALIMGKTNLDEFAMGSSSEHSAYFPVKNPWDLKRTPGGSSGGSAAAVAARLTPISLGTDTGGSIRQPASFTGTVGFKPTYGRVSRYGLVAFGSSLDVVGPFTNSVEDTAYVMEILGRPCTNDSTSYQQLPEPYLDMINQPLQGKKIGVPWNFIQGMNGEALQLFKEALAQLENLGCEIVDIDLELLNHSIPVYYILSTAEASTNLARFDGVRYGNRSKDAKNLDEIYELSKKEGFGPEVKQRIILGTFVLSSEHQEEFYRKAQRVRTLIINEYKRAFTSCDVIVTPTSPNEAFELDSIKDPLNMYLQDLYTIGANLAGLPAVSVPCGHFEGTLPYGIQFFGRQGDDSKVLQFAHQFEQEHTFEPKTPPRYA